MPAIVAHSKHTYLMVRSVMSFVLIPQPWRHCCSIGFQRGLVHHADAKRLLMHDYTFRHSIYNMHPCR